MSKDDEQWIDEVLENLIDGKYASYFRNGSKREGMLKDRGIKQAKATIKAKLVEARKRGYEAGYSQGRVDEEMNKYAEPNPDTKSENVSAELQGLGEAKDHE